MANRELILDGLAWAGIREPVRVAKISAMLVRETYGTYNVNVTKTRIKDAVRNTSPPYGRGKAISELVGVEVQRQMEIHKERQTAQAEFSQWKEHVAKHETRLNAAYAHAFDRPIYAPWKSYPGQYSHDTYEVRQAWEDKEHERDKGDACLEVSHWGDHVVCLVECMNDLSHHHIATRLHSGEIVRTYLRQSDTDLVQAAMSLGGPKVKAAFAQGIRVTTDWVGRNTTIHYTGGKAELTLPWRAVVLETQVSESGYESVVELPVLIKDGALIMDA